MLHIGVEKKWCTAVGCIACNLHFLLLIREDVNMCLTYWGRDKMIPGIRPENALAPYKRQAIIRTDDG